MHRLRCKRAFGVERTCQPRHVEQARHRAAERAQRVVAADRRAAVHAVDAAGLLQQLGSVEPGHRTQQALFLKELGERLVGAVTAPAFELYGLGLEHKHVPEMQKHAGLARAPIFAPSVGRYSKGMIVEVPLPLAAIAVFMTERSLAKIPWQKRDHSIDIPGAVLVVAATTCLLLALTFGAGDGWLATRVLLLFAAALVLAVLATALANPQAVREEHQPQRDVAVIAVDRSSSQLVGQRPGEFRRGGGLDDLGHLAAAGVVGDEHTVVGAQRDLVVCRGGEVGIGAVGPDERTGVDRSRAPADGQCDGGTPIDVALIGPPAACGPTSASCGARGSWRSSSMACARDSQAYTSKSVPSAKASVSAMSASSSTMSSAGLPVRAS